MPRIILSGQPAVQVSAALLELLERLTPGLTARP